MASIRRQSTNSSRSSQSSIQSLTSPTPHRRVIAIVARVAAPDVKCVNEGGLVVRAGERVRHEFTSYWG